MRPKSPFKISLLKAMLLQIVDSGSSSSQYSYAVHLWNIVVSMHRGNKKRGVCCTVDSSTPCIPRQYAVAAARVDFSIRAGCALCIPVDATPRTDVTPQFSIFSRGSSWPRLVSSRLVLARPDSTLCPVGIAPSRRRCVSRLCANVGDAHIVAQLVLHLQVAFRVRSLLDVAECRRVGRSLLENSPLASALLSLSARFPARRSDYATRWLPPVASPLA